MAERPVRIEELFKEELEEGIPIAKLGRDLVDYVELDEKEKRVVLKVFRDGIEHLRKVAPAIADEIAKQEKLVLKAAGIAKAKFPTLKSYEFPSRPGTLGVAWLIPQALKYNTTTPTDYDNNAWTITVTAGTKAYILGSDTAFYRTSGETGKHAVILILHNGLLEIGDTPVTNQFRIISEAKQDYGAYTVEPLVEIPVGDGSKAIYQYPTPMGAMLLDWDIGVKWYFMPKRNGKANMPLLALMFYEHDFLADVKWVS